MSRAPQVLIVDDEANLRRMVSAVLVADGFRTAEAASGEEAIAAVQRRRPDAVLLDLQMPGLDGLATLERLGAETPGLPVVMMSGRAGLQDAVRATRLGAHHFLEKPLAPETVLLTLRSALALAKARAEAQALREELGPTATIVGNSPQVAELRETIAKVAGTEARVHVTGESGTGKELVASAIHAASPRADGPFVRVNCAAIPRELVESEMFGHERGSFTGATERRIGRFEQADNGTLFLDEVGDLSLEAQAKLLRALEAGEIERVGGERPIPVDVRVVSATNKDLARESKDGRFREDLLYRLNVFPVHIPPLRERPGDIPELVAHLAGLVTTRIGRPVAVFDAAAMRRLVQHRWPGNVRELANIVERLIILASSAVIGDADVLAALPARDGADAPLPAPGDAGGRIALADALDAYERTLITRALSAAGGNVAEAARSLDTDRPNLYRRMKRLGIEAIG
ncbi:MAG TPA: sigma-54 dependent transcriptional regulator [Gemmatimonadales bacterium]|jgi:two-component system nitrogen regulation response regulator NtrX